MCCMFIKIQWKQFQKLFVHGIYNFFRYKQILKLTSGVDDIFHVQ